MVSEKQVEAYFKKAVEVNGGQTYKFTSPAFRGVADQIACLPNGSTWFVELKTKGGNLSELQKLFASTVQALNQNYTCLWTIEQIDQWIENLKLDK